MKFENQTTDAECLSNFEFIWEKWIVPTVEKVFAQIDENFKTKCNARILHCSEIKPKAEKYFQERRAQLKDDYYGQDGDKENEEHRMDFHKLSAIICRTMVEYKTVTFDLEKCEQYSLEIDPHDTNWLIRNSLINYRIAFLSSVVFLYNAMLFKYQDEAQINQKLRDQRKLILYDSAQDIGLHESFENYMVLDLAKRDINNRSFDYFMYAANMFQLEEYNRILLNCNNK